jgi:putative tryptophan/tyrosine transport system substrate-binding protein
LRRVAGRFTTRRKFVALLGAATAWPLRSRAEQPGLPVVGYLNSGWLGPQHPQVETFLRGLREAGFTPGENVTIEYRRAEGRYERLPELAAELAARNVAVIAATGGLISAFAARAATSTIPIVFAGGADPVKAGLVASLERPGRNITGVTQFHAQLGSKRLDLLHQIVPRAGIVAVLVNPNTSSSESEMREVQDAAQALDLEVHPFAAATEHEIDDAFAKLVERHADAVLIASDPFFNARIEQLAALAVRHALPAIYTRREFPLAGGLMSYGTRIEDMDRQVGTYVGKILAGTKPSDLPVVQPTKFDFVINRRAAKALGIEIPATLIVSADEVID